MANPWIAQGLTQASGFFLNFPTLAVKDKVVTWTMNEGKKYRSQRSMQSRETTHLTRTPKSVEPGVCRDLGSTIVVG